MRKRNIENIVGEKSVQSREQKVMTSDLDPEILMNEATREKSKCKNHRRRCITQGHNLKGVPGENSSSGAKKKTIKRRRFKRMIKRSKEMRHRHRVAKGVNALEALQKESLKLKTEVSGALETSTAFAVQKVEDWTSVFSLHAEMCNTEERVDSARAREQKEEHSGRPHVNRDGILFVVPANISGHSTRVLIDSGATRCYLSHELVEPFGLFCCEEMTYLELADGSKSISYGKCPNVYTTVGSVGCKVDYTVTKLFPGIGAVLGINWLQAHNPLIDWSTHQMWIRGVKGLIELTGRMLPSTVQPGTVKMLAPNVEEFDHSLAASIEILKTPRFWTYNSSQISWKQSSTKGLQNESKTCDAIELSEEERKQKKKKIQLEVTTQKVHGVPVKKTKSVLANQRVLLNAKQFSKVVQKEGCHLALVREIMEANDWSWYGEHRVARKDMAKGYKHRINKETGPKKDFPSTEEIFQQVIAKAQEECQGELRNIIEEYKDVFPEKLPKGRPPRREIEHSIELETGTQPPNKPPYKLSPAENDELRAQIEELLQQGFIRPSRSPYGAPVLFVPKKDGRWRLCIDYRMLNKATIKDRYPLPRIDDLLERLGKAKYFTKLDLASGYHQIAMKEKDIPKTAFRTRYGSYEFIVMSFGLTNAPATFQRLMNKIFAKELDAFILVFLDDILIYSETLEEHYEHIRQTLNKLREHKFYGRLHKCEFIKNEVEYLGFQVSSDGVRPSYDKVKAVAEWPTPSCVKDIRSFLGLASFYRKFIRHFSAIASPLTELTKDGQKWRFEKNETQAFLQLKAALINAPVLRLPDFSRPFVVTTDANLVSVGAILEQDFGHGLQPVAYESKKLSTAEQRYGAYERELLGIVWAVGKWKHFLQNHFVIQTDHSTLTSLPNQKAVNRRVWKWIALLQDYDMEIRHIPGLKNKADPLTRRSWLGDKVDVRPTEKEEEDLVTRLRVREGATPEEIQRRLQQVFNGPEVIQLNDEEPRAKLMMQISSVTIDADFRVQILEALQNETKYEDLFEKLLSTRIVNWEQKTWRLRSNSLQVKVEEKFREDHDDGWRMVIPLQEDIKQKILSKIHSIPYAGHPGYNRTLLIARRWFWWKGMAEDVREFVLSCPVCQIEKTSHLRPGGTLQPLDIPSRKWDTVVLDFITGLPLTTRNHDTILSIVDKATKMVHFIPCNISVTGAQAAKLYWRKVGYLHGVPRKIITDRDPRFMTDYWTEMWRLLGTSLAHGTAYHPQSSGQIERFNQVIEQTLRCLIHAMDDARDWELLLPTAEFTINSTANRTTGYTPFYLNYGYHPIHPMQMLSDIETTKVESVGTFVSRMQNTFQWAKVKLQEANDAMLCQE